MPTLVELFKGYKTLPAFFREIKKDFFEPFGWIIWLIVIIYVPFLRPWWWVIFPVVLAPQLRKLYLWWVAWDFDYKSQKWVVLEIIPPKEVLVPIKAMDDVFSVTFNTFADTANFREQWCEGELDDCPYWMSYEIMSIEGNIHFLARVNTKHRKALENALYAHYPELEINEVADYAELIPHNIPNDEWDMYGEDYILAKEAPYPIKTYEEFFEPQGEKISAEEKRIDPINSLLEAMSKLKQGEYYWLQFILMGAFESDEPRFRPMGEEIVNKLARRSGPAQKKSFFGQIVNELIAAIHVMIGGKTETVVGEDSSYTTSEEGEREMVLTPGEREIMTKVERKLSKPIYRTTIRGMYIAKRENWDSSNRLAARSYMAHFSTNHLNYLRFSNATRTKVHDLFRKRRVFYRARKMLRNAIMRFPPMFPDRKSECPLLTPEELATMFHFPIKISGLVLPTLERVESKKGGPPLNLPIERESRS